MYTPPILPTILSLLGGEFLHHSWGNNLFANNKLNNFAVMVPAGTNNIMAMIDKNNLLVHSFVDGSISYKIEWNKPTIKLDRDSLSYDSEKLKFLLGYMKASTNCLIKNQCGLDYDN